MDSIERKLAAELLRIGAVLLRPDEPFTWASGWHSPIYCDNRRIFSDPGLRSFVAESVYQQVAAWVDRIDGERDFCVLHAI